MTTSSIDLFASSLALKFGVDKVIIILIISFLI